MGDNVHTIIRGVNRLPRLAWNERMDSSRPVANVRTLVRQEIDGSERSDKPSWSKISGPFQMTVWRRRYFTLDSEEYHYRTIHFQISVERDNIAAGHFVEWRGPSSSDMECFYQAADIVSNEDYEFAEAVLSSWDRIPPLFDFGTLVRFERLAIRPTILSSLVWKMIATMIHREFGRRGSAMLLKAFPLEYEGALGQSASSSLRQKFEKRRRAMERHYGRVLKVQLLPGAAGKSGWMWRSLHHCPHPSPSAP